MENSKGLVTIPTDLDVVPETLELMKRFIPVIEHKEDRYNNVTNVNEQACHKKYVPEF